MTAHRLPRDLAFNDYHVRRDPGSAGVLAADMSNVTYSIDTGGVETRVLASPQRAGIRITITLASEGGTMTLSTAGAETINDGTTVGATVTFDDELDSLDLVSVRSGAAGSRVYQWFVVANMGCTLNA